jgi:signal transduction histidine kinase
MAERVSEADAGRRIRGIVEIARDVLADLDVEVVLGRVLDAARDLTGAHSAAMGVLDESRTELARFLTVGLNDDERAAIGPLPRGRGVLGELIKHPVPLRLPNVERHPRSYGFPLGHPPMKTFLGVPVIVGGQTYGNLYLTDKETGDDFTPDDEQAVAALAELAGIAIDHARRYAGSEARRAELQETVDALDASLEIARSLGGETDLGTILELVAKRGRALVSARVLLIELRERDTLVVAAGAGELPDGLVGQRLALADTVASAAMRTRTTQLLADELNRARFEQHGAGRLGLEAAGGIVVPLLFRGIAYGVLVAIDRLSGGPGFSVADQRLLESFASSAATAVATAHAGTQARRAERLAASEQERSRWARELHDETLQGIAAIRVRLETARQTGDPASLDQAVEQTIAQLRSEAVSLRALITELRPAVLDQLGTKAAIEALAERAQHDGLSVDLAIDLADDARHDSELETAIYRIVQEGLTNARKHGDAARAIVEISEAAGDIHIAIRDDGGGFDPAAATDGFGLVGIRERAELFEGSLDVRSSPGAGTTLTIRLSTDVSSLRRAG